MPRNVLEIQAIVSEQGAIDVPALSAELRKRRIPLAEERLHSIVERYDAIFSVDPLGRVVLAIHEVAVEEQAAVPTGAAGGEAGWLSQAWDEPLATELVLVLDIETTGLSRVEDEVTEIALVGLDGSPRFLWRSADGNSGLAAALAAVGDLLASASAVVGQNIQRFDLPFLRTAAERAGTAWAPSPCVLDVHQLSLLVDPTLDGRTLGSLCHHFGVELVGAHTAEGDALATAAVARKLLGLIDPQDPSWALTLRALSLGRLGWDRLVDRPNGTVDLHAALGARADPLVDPSTHAGSAAPVRRAVDQGFATYGATIAGYRERATQLEMAHAVGDVLHSSGHLLIEAPTGTGKSLAYLVPAAWRAAKAGTPVVIATHTKVLQRQLRGDAEALRAVGVLTAPFRQIQGVQNYLCPRNVAETLEAGEASTDWFAVAVAIRALAQAPNGVWDDLTDGLSTRSDLRYRRQKARLRATSGSCDRWACDFVDQCPLYQRLQGIDRHPGIIATNHALVAIWAKNRVAGTNPPGKLFGDRPTALVIDEAHNLENSLTSAWADRVSGVALGVFRASIFGRHGLVRSARDLSRSGTIPSEPVTDLAGLEADVIVAIAELGSAVADYLHDFGGQGNSVELRPAIVRARPLYLAVVRTSTRLAGLLGLVQARLISVSGSGERAKQILGRRIDGAVDDAGELIDALVHIRELRDAHAYVHQLSAPDPADGGAPSEEWEFARLPIEIGPLYRSYLAPMTDAVVHTSATLRVNESFGFIGDRLGLSVQVGTDRQGSAGPDAVEAIGMAVESPFDHDEQSALVLTSHLPLPLPVSQQEFCEELGADQVGFLSLTGGRSLGLFAARSRMTEVAAVVREHEAALLERNVELLVQGEDSPARIQDRFRSEPGTSVFGLRSYWEGFDAPGETLSYLMIEKPPYPHPDDILAKARQRAIQDRGGDSFLEYVVPLTAIALTQGFGRLIRREDDRGVALIADRRMQQPSAANGILLNTLPTKNLHYAADREDAWRFAIEFVTGEEPNLAEALLVSTDKIGDLLTDLRLDQGEDPEAKLRRAAQEIFGIDDLRSEQIEIMRAILDGRDVLGFLPTGSGKSLTFQLPALLHPAGLPTIVVSPLVALIKDQVDELRGRRGIRVVAGITGRTSGAERIETMRDLAEGKVRLLYVSPERLVRDPTLRRSIARQDLGALVVDEAHCVSSWGHDFRPEFRQIASAVKTFRRSPRLALTATATREVEADIEATLELVDPLVVRRPVDRPDLAYWVRPEHRDADRTRELLRIVAHMGDEPGIVYASRRALTEELAWILRESGVTARAYHAGMVPEQREAVQDDYLAGTTQIIVATKAFGMGVNKPDIGWVVHYDLPESLEGYAQEAGRAARSPELHGLCVLLFTKQDIARRRNHLARAASGNDQERAEALLAKLDDLPTRGGDHIIDPDVLAGDLELETDELNVTVAWLERAGAIERIHDCSARARVSAGHREPEDQAERGRFVKLVKHQLGCRIGSSRLVDIADAAAEAEMEPDELEEVLIDWSLRRLVTFQTTQRRWRLRRTGTYDAAKLRSVIAAWRRTERRRLDEIIAYATGTGCRRAAILEAFGDPEGGCGPGLDPCDVHAATAPPWHVVPADEVIDPESLVDVDTVVLQAVRWSRRFEGGRYGETGLRAALCGKESLGEGRPIGRGLLSCPQFGALRYLRSNEKRLETSVDGLIAAGLIGRAAIDHAGRTYRSLELTESGRAQLDGLG